eukprot:jgi/Chlat1/1362/Chrsp119S01765
MEGMAPSELVTGMAAGVACAFSTVAVSMALSNSRQQPRPNGQARQWIVRTQSRVRKFQKLAEPCCEGCAGTGSTACKNCFGRGRVNHMDKAMLPAGEWPHWCWVCKGAGFTFCMVCMGSGELRGPMGFRLPRVQE